MLPGKSFLSDPQWTEASDCTCEALNIFMILYDAPYFHKDLFYAFLRTSRL